MTQFQFQHYYFQCDLLTFYIKTCVEIKNEKQNQILQLC